MSPQLETYVRFIRQADVSVPLSSQLASSGDSDCNFLEIGFCLDFCHLSKIL